MAFRDCGWVWEGQGLDPGVHPSIFGVGEGAAFFGLERVHYMFHPNTDLAMRKMTDMGIREIVCDISKWGFEDDQHGGSRHRVDASPERVTHEAASVASLASRYPAVTGAIHDDMKGLVTRDGIRPEGYAPVVDALKARDPALNLWTVVYARELTPDQVAFWDGFSRFIDVVELWIWEAKNIPTIDNAIARCRTVFPGKPIVMGCYLRDYPTASPVPMDLLKLQWERVAEHVSDGSLAGYAILGTVLIDGQQEQAEWVRDFIAGV